MSYAFAFSNFIVERKVAVEIKVVIEVKLEVLVLHFVLDLRHPFGYSLLCVAGPFLRARLGLGHPLLRACLRFSNAGLNVGSHRYRDRILNRDGEGCAAHHRLDRHGYRIDFDADGARQLRQ